MRGCPSASALGKERTMIRHVPRPAWAGVALGVVAGTALALGGVVTLGGRSADGDPLEPGEIVILSGRDDSPGGQRQALVDLWNAVQPAHRARIEEVAEVADGQRSEMLDRVWGLPFNTDAGLIFYRSDRQRAGGDLVGRC